MGAIGTRLSLRPLIQSGETKSKARTIHVARMRSCVHTYTVIVRLDRAIQYAAASRLKHRGLWNTGSPGRAGR